MNQNSNLTPLHSYIVVQAEREIHVQISFAFIAFDNITKKGEGSNLLTFSSIHSFLTHCANISKLLWSAKKSNSQYKEGTIGSELGKDLSDILNISNYILLQDKTFRNDLDHYDERMVKWVKEEYFKKTSDDSDPCLIRNLTIGDKKIKALNLRNYNPITKVYTYAERDLDLGALYKELLDLKTALEKLSN